MVMGEPAGGVVAVTCNSTASKRNVASKAWTPAPSAARLKAPASMCIVCTPWAVTGSPAKVKVIVWLACDSTAELAGRPFTLRSAPWTVAGLTALVRVTTYCDGVLPITTEPLAGLPLLTVNVRLGGMLKSSVTEPELELLVTALAPRPRRAKAVQISSRSAPPLRALSAAMIASRDWVKLGLAGWSFIASITSRRASLLPAWPGPAAAVHPVARFESKPYLLTSSQFMSHSAEAQISPVLWTSLEGSLL